MNSPESHADEKEMSNVIWIDSCPEAFALLDLIEEMEAEFDPPA